MVARTCPISVRKSPVLSSFVPSPRRGRGAPGVRGLFISCPLEKRIRTGFSLRSRPAFLPRPSASDGRGSG